MAEAKKNKSVKTIGAAAIHEVGNEAQAVVAAPKLIEFSRWVSGATMALRMEAELGKGEIAPTEAMQSAWAALCQEKALLPWLATGFSKGLTGIFQGGHHNQQMVWGDHLQLLMSGLNEQALDQLKAGLVDLVSNIRSVEGEIKKAGSMGAGLLSTSASQDLLSYPALGVGLSPGNSIVDGKKTSTLVGVKLRSVGAVIGHVDHPVNETVDRWANALGDGVDAEMRAEMTEAAKLSKADISIPWLNFAATDQKDAGPSLLAGELPLPSVDGLKKAWDVYQASTVPASRVAYDAYGIDPGNSGYYYYQGPNRIHLGFADVTPRMSFADNRSMATMKSALGGWTLAMMAAIGGKSSAKMDALDRAKKTRLDQSFTAQASLDESMLNAKALEKFFGEKELTSKGFRVGGHYNQTPSAMAGMGYLVLLRIQKGEWDPAVGEKLKVDFAEALFAKTPKAKVGSMSQMAESLRAGDPAIGLAQMGAALIAIRRQVQSMRSGYSASVAADGDSPLEKSFGPVLDELAQAFDSSRNAFSQGAFEKALSTESTWMESKGLAAAWKQSGAAGARSPKSIGWALANPVAESLDSSDPMERLAAQCARGLGLNAKAGAGALVASLRAELSELGSDGESLDRLVRQPRLAKVIADLAGAGTSADKKKAHSSAQALRFVCHAMSAANKEALSEAMTEDFILDYIVEEPIPAGQNRYVQRVVKLDLFSAGAGGADGRFDGLGPGLSAFAVGSVEKAKLASEVCKAKVDQYPQMMGALARDWRDSAKSAGDLGLDADKSHSIASTRAQEIRTVFPSQALIDWRKKPFASSEAWQVFCMPSPRFSAAAADAQSSGGELGQWCAARARRLGVADAVDGNDLVAKSRDKIKERCEIPDGAWKLAIKDPGLLQVINAALQLNPEDRNHAIDQARLSNACMFENGEGSGLARRVMGDSGSQGGVRVKDDAVAGIALRAASNFGIKPEIAGIVLNALTTRSYGGGYAHIFGDNIAEVVASGSEGADFFIAEAKAKADKMPRIFVECCKRYEKLVVDSDKAKAKEASAPKVELAEGQEARGGAFDPLKKLNEELLDLCDWIGKSEHGLWSELPVDPTFGQLSRMSKAWHDEQAAIALDKADRARVAKAVAEAVFEADASSNPFAVSSGSRWGKILGKHSRDGWEAVELQTAADLSEEGATMRHCVSSYSPQCRSGQSRIYSIRLNGERKCTLQINGSEGLSKLDANTKFSIMQNKGASNQAVNNAATLAFCEEVLAKVQSTWPNIVAKIEKARDAKNDIKKDIMKVAKQQELERIEAERSSKPKMAP